MGSFRILDHTGEVGILARGESMAEVFSQAARGMFSLMVDLDTVQEVQVRQVEASASDREALLVAWLDELIYLFDVEGMVFKGTLIQEIGDTHVKALCHGERLDPDRHQVTIVPKAATYHMLEVKPAADGAGWEASVILDV